MGSFISNNFMHNTVFLIGLPRRLLLGFTYLRPKYVLEWALGNRSVRKKSQGIQYFFYLFSFSGREPVAVGGARHVLQAAYWTSYLIFLMLAAEGWCIIRRKPQLHKYTLGKDCCIKLMRRIRKTVFLI